MDENKDVRQAEPQNAPQDKQPAPLSEARKTALLRYMAVLFAVVGLCDGSRPSDIATFAGYLITTLAFLPVAFVLARMEPTRWGTLILGVACLVMPVLVLRLQQIASVTNG